ncbi:helix-turn-helix domain-containing protein [Candidatus Marinimicrobia bacterium]|nr:helix-turn-helix domain-containing protein [Candidatus Neomarinimicrobiota bacterium]
MIFYSRYKKFRLENKISLEDIQRRTKIDLISLKAIEAGKFSEISNVYVRLFFKAYLKEIGIDVHDGIEELDEFLNQKNPIKKVRVKKNKKEDNGKSLKFVDIINTDNVFNPNILIGLVVFIILVLLSFFLNSSTAISDTDKENELRISKSDIENLYAIRTQEILSEQAFSFPITIRFKSNNENYIEYSDKDSGKEYFIFEEKNNVQSNSFSEIWNGDNKTFLIANTVDFELIFFSEDTFSDFSDSITNDFPVKVDLISDPLSVSITKYIPKNR